VVTGGQCESWTNKGIAILDVESGVLSKLTEPETAALAPAWSPDGKLIAYVRSVDLGPDGRDASLTARRIWLMTPDGSNERRLTDGDEGDREELPQWSTDGRNILFARLTTDPCDTSEYSLWLMNLEDRSLDRIEAELPLFVTNNERLEVGEIPICRSGGDGPVTDMFGRLSLISVLDWWQPSPAIAP
jgi:dipeptidyl aminopeptidase/acylaminoacyl peptidase